MFPTYGAGGTRAFFVLYVCIGQHSSGGNDEWGTLPLFHYFEVDSLKMPLSSKKIR
jgi:hypothetical protein